MDSIELLPRIAVFRWQYINKQGHYYTVLISWLCWSREIDIGYKE